MIMHNAMSDRITVMRKWFRVAQLMPEPLRYKFLYALVELLVDGVMPKDERVRELLRQYGILEELEKVKKKSEAGKKGMEKRWKNNPVNNSDNNSDNNSVNNREGITNNINKTLNVKDIINISSNNKDILNNRNIIYNNKDITNNQIKNNIKKEKEKGEKEKERKNAYNLSPEWAELIEEWLQYKRSRRETYKSSQSIRALITRIKKLSGNNPQQAKKIIEQSIANNWAGLFALKNNNYDRQKQNQIRDITEDWGKEENNLIRL